MFMEHNILSLFIKCKHEKTYKKLVFLTFLIFLSILEKYASQFNNIENVYYDGHKKTSITFYVKMMNCRENVHFISILSNIRKMCILHMKEET